MPHYKHCTAFKTHREIAAKDSLVSAYHDEGCISQRPGTPAEIQRFLYSPILPGGSYNNV